MKKTFACLLLIGFSTLLSAQDTIPPVLVCKDNVPVFVAATCIATAWASSVIDQLLFDNENGTVEIGIRKRCAGDGFPENKVKIEYVCGLGYQPVEVWVRDSVGNTTYCFTRIIVQDNAGSCDPFGTVTTNTPHGDGIINTKITVLGVSPCFMDSVYEEHTTYSMNFWGANLGAGIDAGCFFTPPGYTTSVTPSKTINPTNGITTYDLVLISKHILGIEPLDTPYKLIAADANLDGQVTTSDIVLLRKLILGIIPEMPHKQSWRYVLNYYVFPNPANPFNPPFPEAFVVPFTDELGYYQYDFIGVKIGDVNFSANPTQ